MRIKPITDISFLERTTEQIVGREDFLKKLASGKQLRIKYGVDVTAPFLHIGHAVNLWMMRWLQERGHKVLFLIGDFTTQIGDPTGKSKTRKIIDPAQIAENAEEFIKQVSEVLLTDPEVFEICRNSDWYGGPTKRKQDPMDLSFFFRLVGRVTHGHLVQRAMFQKRIEDGEPIHMHEFLYPILQGWDSVELQSDLTIVGSDQLFNEMMGRTFQEQESQQPQTIITTKITPGLCGKEKQSKSLGNYIAITDSPRDKFGKVMSIPDALIMPYFEVYTDVPDKTLATIKELLEWVQSGTDPLANPMGVKKDLAASIVKRYHDQEAADSERVWFEETFSKKNIPEDAPLIEAGPAVSVIELLKQCRPKDSSSQLRRLLEQGAISLEGKKLTKERLKNPWCGWWVGPDGLPSKIETHLKIGKRSWYKIRLKV